MPATRSSLLSRVRDLNDRDGWAEFDRLYRPLLVEYAQRRRIGVEDAEEVAQQCLTVIVGRIGDFQRSHSFRGWLRRMVEHKVADLLEQRIRARPIDSRVIGNRPARDESPEALWRQQWNRAHLHYLMARLADDFAEHTLQAFALYVLHDRSVDDICRMLGMTPNQVYVAKSRVLARVRKHYPDLFDSLYVD